MPKDGPVGHSAATEVKQAHFDYVMPVMLTVARSCMGNAWAHPEFVYIDLNAGKGVVGGVEGSPLRFIRHAIRARVPFRAYFLEQDGSAAEELKGHVRELATVLRPEPGCAGTARVIVGDHNQTVPRLIEGELSALPKTWVYGLAYGDGNGMRDTPVSPLTLLGQRFPKLDQLLNVNAVIYKRLRGQNPDSPFLLSELERVPKSARLIREPVGEWQWTMLFLTNWSKPPQFQRIGFYDVTSPAGRRIVDRVNFRKPERDGDGAFPFVLRLPTGPTPSTSGILASLPSAPSPSSGAAASVNAATSPAPPSPTT